MRNVRRSLQLCFYTEMTNRLFLENIRIPLRSAMFRRLRREGLTCSGENLEEELCTKT
jgi:hypothetical protein